MCSLRCAYCYSVHLFYYSVPLLPSTLNPTLPDSCLIIDSHRKHPPNRCSSQCSCTPPTRQTTQINRYLLATAKLVATIAAMTPKIPKNHPNPVLDLPGTGTFIPNKPQIKFSGTRIDAKSVIFDKT